MMQKADPAFLDEENEIGTVAGEDSQKEGDVKHGRVKNVSHYKIV